MNIKKRQEVINLMPWFNLGKLSPEEKSMVESALIEDPSLKGQLTLDQDIMARIIADPTLLDKSAFAPSTVRLEKVLAQIDETVVKKIADKAEIVVKKERQPISMFAGVKSFFTDLISGSSHSFTYAVFAALTVVQLALLMFFVAPSVMQEDIIKPTDPITAAGEPTMFVPDPSATNIVVISIIMKDNVKINDITKVLDNELSNKIKSYDVVGDKTQP